MGDLMLTAASVHVTFNERAFHCDRIVNSITISSDQIKSVRTMVGGNEAWNIPYSC